MSSGACGIVALMAVDYDAAMAITIFQHSDVGGPGRLGATLRDHGFLLDIRRLDLPPEEGGRGVPPDLDNVQGVVILGGPQNVGDNLPWLRDEMQFIKSAHESGLPVLGICLGHQLIAAALGGEVSPMPKPEAGFHTVSINTTGQIEAMLAGIAWKSPQFCLHGREVSAPPKGAVVLASSEACKVQAFRVGVRTFGFQYHFESDLTTIRRYLRERPEEFAAAGLSSADVEAQATRHYEAFARLANRLCVNLVTLCFPMRHRLSA